MLKKTILRKKLPESGVDGILITDLNNLRYITGFTGSSGFLIVTRSAPVFVTDFRYQEQAKKQVHGFKIIIETGERTGLIKDIASEYGIKKLGFEDNSISYRIYKRLLKNKLKLKALPNIAEDLRMIKSAEELLYIKEAVKRAESAFRKLLSFVKPGVTELALAMKMESLLKESGCKMIPFGVIVASGQNSALPHARPSNTKLKKGDLVLFDWGGEYEGYFSDISRTVFLSAACMGQRVEIYNMALKAQSAAVKAVKPGIKANIIDKAARNLIKQGGYGDYFGHGTGHGVGLAVHEKPFISWRSNDKIEKGMVFTVEPGIYLPGLGGVRIEDMVFVGRGGAEVLTTLPKKLHIIN